MESILLLVQMRQKGHINQVTLKTGKNSGFTQKEIIDMELKVFTMDSFQPEKVVQELMFTKLHGLNHMKNMNLYGIKMILIA